MEYMRLILKIIVIVTILTVLIIGIFAYILTKINIDMGPYECVDVNGNNIICEQTWRSYGVLYGITEDGLTINLKSYKSIQE